MSIDANELRSLTIPEKLRIVEMLWDDLAQAPTPIPLPDWVNEEASRRRREMQDPSVGLSHQEVWQRIEKRNG
jgi:putative addiction module component (TIGR02574 family)